MNCEDFRKCLDNYENLTETEKLAMNAHAAECESCADELDFMLSIIKTAKSLPKIPSPPDFMDNLNIRIDAEERKRQRISFRIAANLRKNRKIYGAAAACFALVAVLTANSANLLDRMKPSDGGVIEQETVVTDNNTSPSTHDSRVSSDGDGNPVSVTDSPFAEPTVPALETKKEAEKNISPQDGYTPAPAVKTAVSVTSAPLKKANETATVSTVSTAEPAKKAAAKPTVTTAATDSKTDFETTPVPKTDDSAKNVQTDIPAEDAKSDIPENSEVDTFSLTRSRMAYDGEIAAVQSDTQETEESGVEERYSLAKEGSIAHGQYYRIDKNGNPIKEEQNKAIGQIKISSDNIDTAMDVVRKYSYSVSGDLYETDSTSLSLMLSSFTENGVLYTNYTPAYTGDIKFRLVIG